MNHDTFIKIITTEPIFDEMRACKEDSPYHREDSVYEHTMMVIEWYDRHCSPLDDDYFIGLFACLFHDLGKPSSKKPCATPGKPWSFSGHDLVSSKLAAEIMERHGFNGFDSARICWMIEHHQVFWSVKDNAKKAKIASAIRNPGLGIDFHIFKMFMLADDFGRICEIRDVDSALHFDVFEREYLN